MDRNAEKSRLQEAAEAGVESFKRELGPFVVAAETTRMPMLFTNANSPDNRIIFVNQALLTLTGYDEHDLLGQGFNFMLEPSTDAEAVAQIQTAFEGGRDLETDVHCARSDGSLFWATVFISPVRDEAGPIVQHFASFVDITPHKEEEERLRSLLCKISDLIDHGLVAGVNI